MDETPIESHLRPPVTPEETERMIRDLKARAGAASSIEQHLAPPINASDRERLLDAFKTRRLQSRRTARRRAVAGLVVACAAALVVFALLPRAPAPGPLPLAAGHPLPRALSAADRPVGFRMADGSRIALAPTTQARVISNRGDEVRAIVDRGRATFEVQPGGPRRWFVRAGAMEVEVLGTRFEVSRAGASVGVTVERGEVSVRHPSLPRPLRLEAGESRRFPTRPSSSDLPAGDTAEAESEAAPPAPAPEPSSPPVEAAPPQRASSWRGRAQAGDFEAAFRVLGRRGLRRAVDEGNSADRLLLADVARNAGHPREAARILERVVRSGGPERAVAAFTLARLRLDQLGDPAGAARSLGDVIDAEAAGAPGSAALLEDALGMRAQALSRAGDAAAARRAAASYLERFPTGRYRGAMERLAVP